MGLELITYSISDIGKVITGKTPPASIKSAYSALDGVPFVTPKDMDGRRWIENTERYLTSDGVAAVKRNLVPAMSVAVSCIGSDMGKAVLLKKESITNQQINSIVIDVKRFNPKYIYYVLSTKQQYFKDIAGGSATPILNKTDFGKVTFQAPSKYYQDLIVEYLDCLDSKRELNRQINQTLEQMAQALFKSWFVDFDPVVDNALDADFFEQDLAFPDELLSRAKARRAAREHGDFKQQPDAIRQLFPAAFEECVEPSLGLGGWVPKGWGVAVSGEHIDVRDGTHDSPKKSEHGFPLVTSKNLTSGRLNLTSAYLITPKDYNEANKRSKVNHGDILLTMIGTLGIPCLVSTKDVNFAIKNIGLFKTSETPHLKSYFFELLKSQEMQQFLDSRAAGTTQKYLSLKVLRTINFVLPCSEVLSGFNRLIQTYENKIQINDEQNSVLADLRDTLLPKLISGELRLDNIEADPANEGMA